MGAAAGADLVDSGAGQALAEEGARAVGQAAIEKFGEGSRPRRTRHRATRTT